MFFTPRPPKTFGEQTFRQATRHCAPEQDSLAAQKKALLLLSMSLIMDLGSKKEDIKYVGRLSRTDERRVNLPPLERREARHPAKYLSQLSIIG
jgi:hypothetical protein